VGLEVLCVFSHLKWTNRYTYSLVFAADMYSTVFKSDPLDPVRGDRYRRSILEPGGSREELESLEVKEVNSSIDKETQQICRNSSNAPQIRMHL
jgi:Zn-dependent oligopeptidase